MTATMATATANTVEFACPTILTGRFTRLRGNINATFVQQCYRRWITRRNYKKLKRRIIMLQRAIGGFMARQKYKKEVKRITRCQAVMRGYICKMIVVKRMKAVRVLDVRMRAYLVGKAAKEDYRKSKER